MPDMVQVRRGARRGYQGPDVKIGRSQFNRSHGLKTTFDASYLVPIYVDEVLPGDTFTMKVEGFCRIWSPLLSPVMDNIEVETLFFFVPNRLVWSNWAAFMGEHDQAGAQDTEYTVPIITTGLTIDHDHGAAVQDLGAYLGLPDGLSTTAESVSALPWRAYNLIYNEWFRDQNVAGALTVNTDNGPDATAAYALRKRSKKHDYFTSCLPYLQKENAQSVALSGTAPIQGIGVETQTFGTSSQAVYESDGTNPTYSFAKEVDPGGAGGANTTIYIEGSAAASGDPQIFADLTSVTVGINALRQAVALQRLYEIDARGGTRYVERIKSHFGVTSPDFRLQRPEYLGGGKSYVNISPVANTSEDASNKQGHLTGVGAGRVTGGWAKSFTEHGYIIGLICARGDITYFQGLEKHWSRSTPEDFYIPALANLGEQSVLNKELWIAGDSTDDNVFGYQQRWEEYRFKKSNITGKMNPDAASALSQWHLAEDFASQPSLNTTFIWDQTPMSRIQAVTTEPDFIADIWFDLRCARPIPVYSIPSLLAPRF